MRGHHVVLLYPPCAVQNGVSLALFACHFLSVTSYDVFQALFFSVPRMKKKSLTPRAKREKNKILVLEQVRKWQKQRLEKRISVEKLAEKLNKTVRQTRYLVQNQSKIRKKAVVKAKIARKMPSARSAAVLHRGLSKKEAKMTSCRSVCRAREPQRRKKLEASDQKRRQSFIHPKDYHKITVDFARIAAHQRFLYS